MSLLGKITIILHLRDPIINYNIMRLSHFNLLFTALTVLISVCYLSLPVLCEGADDFPSLIMQFDCLHNTECLKSVKATLNGQSGVYVIKCLETGGMYIGSSADLGDRWVRHIFNNSSNLHLQNAIVKYGLYLFTFSVIEYCAKDQLLSREQHWLDWLFSLPSHFRYNFSPVAGAPMAGRVHTEDTKALLSAAKQGANNPMYGRAGSLNPMYGTVAPCAVGVSVYNLDYTLIQTFTSQSAAAKFLGVGQPCISKAIKKGSIVKGTYRVASRLYPL